MKDKLPPQPSWNDLTQPEVTFLDEAPRRHARSVLLGKMAEYLTVSVFVLTIMVYQWVHWYFQWPAHPAIFTGVGVCLVGYALLRIAMMVPKLRSLKNEARAAQSFQHAMEQLTARGWYLFHQVRDSQNRGVGSMLVGRAGVFNLHVRYMSRTGKAFESIERGPNGSILVGGKPALGHPVDQANRATNLAYAMLAEAGLETVAIQPALIFPAWEVSDRVPDSGSEEADERPVWVLNEGGLVERIMELSPVLEPKQLIQICTIFERAAANAN